MFRREALLRHAQPEALDDLLRVTAAHERVFLLAFGVSVLFVLVAVAFLLN
ncbi:MAG: hypothetical protein OXH88_01735 [Gammaproteobacteria bacterium]|nr:hypothetical protein [Gammaproteobacteria bacterium]